MLALRRRETRQWTPEGQPGVRGGEHPHFGIREEEELGGSGGWPSPLLTLRMVPLNWAEPAAYLHTHKVPGRGILESSPASKCRPPTPGVTWVQAPRL